LPNTFELGLLNLSFLNEKNSSLSIVKDNNIQLNLNDLLILPLYRKDVKISDIVNYLKSEYKITFETYINSIVRNKKIRDELTKEYKFLFVAGNVLFTHLDNLQNILTIYSNIINTNYILYKNYNLNEY
jgi:hypothetical protein